MYLISQAIADIVTTESGMTAMFASAATLAAVKGFDYLLQRKSQADQGAMAEATAIRKELREEAKSLREDLRQMVVENDKLRNEYFDLKAECNRIKFECDVADSDRVLARAQLARVRHEMLELSSMLDSSGYSEQAAYKLDQIMGEAFLMEPQKPDNGA